MTSRDDASAQIYIPALHKALAGPSLPGTVLFLDPGLPQTERIPGCYRPDTLPFSREKAAQILAELLAIGEALDVAGPSGSQAARQKPHKAAVSPREEADLIRFSAAHEAAGSAAVSTAPAAVAAQKVLLLAWDLEERLLEIRQIHQDIIAAAKPLDESIHGPHGGPDDAEDPVLDVSAIAPASAVSALSALPEMDEPDWRLTVTAIAAFLPEDAILVTTHPALRDALREEKLLAPLPETVNARLAGWPPALLAASLWTKAPLWRVLGYARAPENAPWLLAEPDIITCPV